MELFSKKKKRSQLRVQDKTSFSRHIFWGVIRLLSIVLVCVCVYYVTRLNAFAIRDITVHGGETISLESVHDSIEQELQGNYFLVVPKRFTYLYPHDRMKEVLEKYPRMYDIVISRTSRTSLDVAFKEYLPHALWCMHEMPEEPCYFINSDGYAFSEAPILVGGALVRHIVEGANEITSGEVITPDKLAAIDHFIEQANTELGFRITSLIYTTVGDIHFAINGGGEIYVASSKNFQTTFDNLRSIVSSPEFKHIEPGNFQYIDVRFDNKVFVNEETSTTTIPTAELPE